MFVKIMIVSHRKRLAEWCVCEDNDCESQKTFSRVVEVVCDTPACSILVLCFLQGTYF